MWNNADIEKTISFMEPEAKYRYGKVAQELFTTRTPDRHVINIEVATQVRLMLRDGIAPDMLTEDERSIFVDMYGIDNLNEYECDGSDGTVTPNNSPAVEPILDQKRLHRAAKRRAKEK